MKANELMLGDWVYGLYPDGSRYKPPFRISAVDTYPSNKNPRIVTEGGYGFQEEHLAPIPITGEILEKNGFKVPGYLVWDLECDAEVQLVPETHDLRNPHMGYRLVVGQKVFGIKDTVICHLKYVHQLQHALKLCGINKEIII